MYMGNRLVVIGGVGGPSGNFSIKDIEYLKLEGSKEWWRWRCAGVNNIIMSFSPKLQFVDITKGH